MTTSINRRRVLQSLGAAAAAPFVHPFSARAQRGPLRVQHFGGPYKALEGILGEPFTAASKIPIEWGVETSVSALTKLQTAPDAPPFDMPLMSRSFGMRAAKAGLLQPIDTARIPNLKDTVNGTLTPGGSGVAMLFDSVDIMVNTNVYKGKINSWMDLWNPDLKGKLIMPSSGISTSLYLLISVIRAMGGKEENEKDVDAAFRKLAELKPNVRTFFSDPIQQGQILERGEAGVAPQFGIRIAALAQTNKNIVRMSPKEGQVAIGYDWVIARGAKDAAAAHRFIDFSIAADQQAKTANTLFGTPVRRGVALSDTAKTLVADSARLIFVDEDFVAAQQRGWLQRWSRDAQG